MDTMALVKNEYAAPAPFLPPAVKGFLEGSKFGRFGLRAGRKIIRAMQSAQNQRKVWIRQFGLPLRNAVLRNRPITVSFEGIPVLLEPRGQIASFFWSGLHFEGHEVEFIMRSLEPGMIFFDVGANAGLYTINAAKKIGGRGVFAFEPCSSTCSLLKRNLQLNGLSDVNVAQMALGDAVSEGVLQINARGKDGLNTLGHATHPDSTVVGQEQVRITTTDVFMRDYNVPRVDVMKVDIEGAELMLFRGARDLLERADAPLILYEGFGSLSKGFGYHPVEILWLLESCGYTLLLLNSDTGEISELKPDYQYDSMVIAVKRGHPSYERLRGVAR
jgi:FkbM family methyltransferase